MSKGGMDDDYFMGRIAMGDSSALAKLKAKYHPGLKGYFVIRANGCLDAEHLAGRVWDKVQRSSARYRPMGRLRNWLYSIALNLLKDEVKRAKREKVRIKKWDLTSSSYPWKYGGKGYRKTSHADYDPNDADPASQFTGDGASPVIDVHAWTRGLEVKMRFRPGKGYDMRKEIKAMFRRFGLVYWD